MKLCIDIGGTQVRSALVDEKLHLTNIFKTETKDPITTLQKLINHYKDTSIEQVNISTCGPIDIQSGVYGNLPNLTSWNMFELRGYLSSKLNCNIHIDNDANCATLFEANSRLCKNLVYITLSTGVGAGAIVSNNLLSGKDNEAMSPYKYYVNSSETMDSGCSGTGLYNKAKLIDNEIQSTKEVFDKVNNENIKELIDSWVDQVALYIVNMQSVLATEIVVLGGSVTVNNPQYVDLISAKVVNMNCNVDIELTKEVDYNGLKGAYFIDER